MTRDDLRRDLTGRLLPRVAAAAVDLGFVPAEERPGWWRWTRVQSPTVTADVLVTEQTGRQVRDGLDLRASGGLVLADVEELLSRDAPRPPGAVTLHAPLRGWGARPTRDAAYLLRWTPGTTGPVAPLDALLADLTSFATFARGIRTVHDLADDRLARSRIRRQTVDGLAPHLTTPDVAAVVRELAARPGAGDPGAPG
ncbi:hypothetical protein [Cellulomonas triticagri]|uniref:Uncharacterized protein n=1 Tax=Cellulomonas triticagri TaxID=2483352 RepID=A0A3M2J684_9CELL|nr:hypothetical protein [Cellulomonas triticagri]RMI07043.1 hypothetical protein EBM89_13990 [Cellulomonas triticagri]